MSRPVYYDETAVEQDAMRYLKAREFLDNLRKVQNKLDAQTYRTLRGQALSGDIQGAQKGLERIMRRDCNGTP